MAPKNKNDWKYIQELKTNDIIGLDPALKVNEVKIIAIEDMNTRMVCPEKQFYIVKIEAISGPFKGSVNEIVVRVDDEILFVPPKTEKKKSWWSNLKASDRGEIGFLSLCGLVALGSFIYFWGYADPFRLGELLVNVLKA